MKLINLERQKGVGTKLQINGSVAGWFIAVLMLGIICILGKIFEGSILLETISYFAKVIFITTTVFAGLLGIISILNNWFKR